MIQRIQSIFIAISAVFMAALFFIPVGKINYHEQLHVLDHLPLLIATFISIIFPLYNLLQFKRRHQQIRTCIFSILLILIVMGLAHFYVHEDPLVFDPAAMISKSNFGSLLPVAAIILQLLAIRAIKKDEALIKSMDRFR